MKAMWVAKIAALAMLVPTAVGAQDSYKISDIDCAQSRIVPPAGVKCRASSVVGGGDSAGGQFQRWALLGSLPYVHVYEHESLNSTSHIRATQTGADFRLQWMNPRAKGATAVTEAAKIEKPALSSRESEG